MVTQCQLEPKSGVAGPWDGQKSQTGPCWQLNDLFWTPQMLRFSNTAKGCCFHKFVLQVNFAGRLVCCEILPDPCIGVVRPCVAVPNLPTFRMNALLGEMLDFSDRSLVMGLQNCAIIETTYPVL
uniref:Uncharacterized protein n=1 Tax=Eutreptiella gymnastica TaxID=73025 RepID=A0A7S1NQP4_9EUGL